MAPRKIPQKLIGYEEAAKLLDVTVEQLKDLCEKRLVHYHKLGKLRRFDPEKLLESASQVSVVPVKGFA